MIEIQRQPPGSNTCGQHCIAMIAGKPVDEIIKLVGHKNGTYTREVITALNALGFGAKGRLIRLKKRNLSMPFRSQLPKLAVLKLIYGDKTGSHWVVYYDKNIYCPGHGVMPYRWQTFIDIEMYPSSYLKIEL